MTTSATAILEPDQGFGPESSGLQDRNGRPGRESPRRAVIDLSPIPFYGTHVGCALVWWAGFSWTALAFCLGAYFIRMFAITAGYHRYFSHRTFKTSRVFQFLLALVGCTSIQKGPLWWAAHHRHHHRFSDTENDIHSPLRRGFWWAHVGWILAHDYDETRWDRIRDFSRFPELRLLNRFHLVPPLLLMAVVYFAFGFQAFVWTSFVSTTLLWHGTFTINSLAHVFGKRVYETTDTSRNSFALALITMGEGWHNNHHFHQSSANQGFRWWELDVTFYILLGLQKLNIVRDVSRAPKSVIEGFKGGQNLRIPHRAMRTAA